jgi:carboxymethylenebutenolidase
MGGALTVLSACFVPELDATVVWYGNPPAEFVDANNITKPMMGHWSMQDEFFSPAGVDELEQKLKLAGVEHEFHRYDAKHAFANPQSDARGLAPLQYHPEAAELAWKRSLDFLKKHLS